MNWKTTLAGLVTAIAGFVLFSPSYFPPWAVDLAKYLTLGGLAGLGMAAKDFDSHSSAAQVNQTTKKLLDQAVTPAPAPTEVVVVEPAQDPSKPDAGSIPRPKL